ncbi:sensor histidine kinase [Mucilaginibacter aquariorum]|uniref:histidine kinase n=1 Tax=Mucilaginibacter aquariorum TaxID=2967225 RepID=A0ABT1SXN5_9SPHI|nr:HAMP domain-containing sensor histidine kinase [Mucilaginibacter aquariorum]MCQ6957022.1 HAMP domain-containing histidine kinase [Mucilaginibacter aquariorum]
MTIIKHKMLTPGISQISVIEIGSVRGAQSNKRGKNAGHVLDLALTADYALESAGLGMWSFDFESKILKICQRCKLVIGIADVKNKLLGKLIGLIPDNQVPALLHAVKLARDRGVLFDILFPVNSYDLQNDRKWFRITGIRPSDPRENGKKLFGTIADVTVNVNLEANRQDLLAIINHEMKSPLTSIKLYVQLCQTVILNENITGLNKYLSNADSMVDKANSLLDYFLKGNTMQTGQLNIFKAEFNIYDLLTEIMNDLRIKHPKHQLLLRNATHSIINADKERIGQVVRNLVTNAIKYSPDPDIVIVSCKINEDHMQISVKDNGIGISECYHQKIFDKYYRVNHELDQQIPGYGIGLYLCKHIINEHQGKIWFISKENHGSTFYFRIPVK